MKREYKEIHRLREMLTAAEIEHEWIDRNPRFDPDGIAAKHFREKGLEPIDWGYQIVVYRPDGETLVSAIEGYGTYGERADRIEIMGLTSEDEDEVVGWLTAENVFARIKHWGAEHG